MSAICQRCGVEKTAPFVACPACGHVPVGAERPVAWLLSDRHLSPYERVEAGNRIRGGRRLSPDPELVAHARREIARTLPPHHRPRTERLPSPAAPRRPPRVPLSRLDDLLHPAGPPGGRLPPRAILAVLVADILLTPVVGWVMGLAWRKRSPAAARQVLRVTALATVALALAWALVLWQAWGGGVGEWGGGGAG